MPFWIEIRWFCMHPVSFMGHDPTPKSSPTHRKGHLDKFVYWARTSFQPQQMHQGKSWFVVNLQRSSSQVAPWHWFLASSMLSRGLELQYCMSRSNLLPRVVSCRSDSCHHRSFVRSFVHPCHISGVLTQFNIRVRRWTTERMATICLFELTIPFVTDLARVSEVRYPYWYSWPDIS